jgi:GNAT superfamily N-acetyltransferase
MTLTFHPVTLDRWPDLERLFSASTEEGEGNPARCWCMEWRRPRAEWEAGQGEGNRAVMKALIESGHVPGILAYEGSEAVAWCSIAPRAQTTTLKERGSFRSFENPDIWTVLCFYISDAARGQGLTVELLRAAVEHARAAGAKVIEGYPVDPEAMPDFAMSRFMGFVSAFRRAGFVEVARRPDGRPVMRYAIV